MSIDLLRLTAQDTVVQLAREEYNLLVSRCVKSRLTADDLKNVIQQYGRKLVAPPASAYEVMDAVQVKGAAVPTWSVRVPVWTEEEGRSDLTLDLTISLESGKSSVELTDLHVL